jgi:hypothetical protein
LDRFLAYDGLGSLYNDLLAKLKTENNAEQNIKTIMSNKAFFGGQNHMKRQLGEFPVNKLFGDPAKFVKLLRESAWIVHGEPQESPFLTFLAGFNGPMFKVFTPDELKQWENWISSLAVPYLRPSDKIDTYDAMLHAVVRLINAGALCYPAHSHKLWGPSPNNSSQLIEQSIRTWMHVSLKPCSKS